MISLNSPKISEKALLILKRYWIHLLLALVLLLIFRGWLTPGPLTYGDWGYHSNPVSYTHLRAHETRHDLVCRLLLEKKKPTTPPNTAPCEDAAPLQEQTAYCPCT